MPGELVPFRKKSRPLYDWGAGFLFFASDPSRTFAQVAEHLGCGLNTVRRQARVNNWEEKRQTLIDKAGLEIERKAIKSLQERHADTIRVAEKLRGTILKPGVEIEVKDAVSALPSYAKLEQLFGGGATENLRALPTIDPDNLTLEELEELARLLEKGQRAS